MKTLILKDYSLSLPHGRRSTSPTPEAARSAVWHYGFWGGQKAAAHDGSEPGLSNAVFREPTEAAWKEAWKITEVVLLLMRDEVAAKGARFFVVVLTTGKQVHPDPEVRKNFAQKLGVPDLFYPDRRLKEFCRRKGIPILLLAPAFQEQATKHQVFFHGFKDSLGGGHWNQHGHRLAGNMLADWLCERVH